MSRIGTAVIGGGLAGSSTALALARRGHDVTVFERDPLPCDKVCGEFLSPEGCREAEAMGLDLARLGGEPVSRLRLLAGGRSISGPLPFRAMTIPRILLDAELRTLAAGAGADIRLGARVSSVGEGELRLGSERVAANRIVLANGKLDLRGWKRTAAPGDRDHYIGLKMHYRPGAETMAVLRDTIVLCFFDGGYAGIVPMDADTCNVSIAVTRRAWTACSRDYGQLCRVIAAECPDVAPVLRGDTAIWPRPLAVGHVPYGYQAWAAGTGPDWLWRVGDQAAVIPSLSGTGMTMALIGGRLLAACLDEGRSQADYARDLRQVFAGPMWRAEGVARILQGRRRRQVASRIADRFPGLLARVARITRVAPGSL
ncbi:NAD(P)/FAD-dependent oxidoreductase [uncultured Jannaschia sp.]|uniref:NAD(P)/FAD-dependent oxidoreductase n=1 Tax=uncultured Jannaschia sp. TaxID=293347 RepID=UPI002636B913|nr:NAD(P)/FAD-dependent oxidoreductase [uncultured Jannaschia sp.]